MQRVRRSAALALLPILSLACNPNGETKDGADGGPKGNASATPASTSSAAASKLPVVNRSLADVGLDESAMDKSVDPCTDFYQFACGSWIQKTEIPGDQPLWARGFSVIREHNEDALHKILDDAVKSPTPETKPLGDYYAACMDEAAVEAAKLTPIDPLLKIVAKVTDAKSLSDVITELHKREIWVLFDVSDTQDAKDATKVIAEIDQGGLGLPDRDYYLKDDAKSKELRDKYVAHVAAMLKLAGQDAASAKKASEDVMRIETELAKASKTRVERREPTTMYNRLDRAGVASAAPKLVWDDYWKGLGFPDVNEITVTAPKFIEAMSGLMASEKPAAWKSYLTFHVIRSLAQQLPKAFVDEAFSMEAALTGQKTQKARWKRCVNATDGAVGELLAQPYVKAFFAPESKEATERYVHEIATAFGDEVQKLEWMSPETKAKAAEKLKAVAFLIGYPKHWKTYDFTIGPKTYLDNVLAARGWKLRFSLSKIGKPVDREEWHMTPPTVNAYYRGEMNHMVFPAGILQPPFFNPKASIPVNLGGMGMVVGHELTHGFDDKGSKYDAKGNLANWWTDDDKARFKTKTDCISDQYAAYEPLPGVKLNGQLTLGENIADAGGVKLAFRAYRSMRKDAKDQVVAGGFTEDQQFFLGVGQAWCSKLSDEVQRLRAQTDPHSPPRFRVNGPLSNSPDFANAFQCGADKPMRRANACVVW